MQSIIEQSAATLLEPLMESETEDYIGEEISQLEHALQAAYWAQQTKAPDEVILAALFHDIGHLIAPDAPQMDGLGVMDHETIGANFLTSNGCSQRMADLVAAHVAAKRYLCHRKPAYYRKLSQASKGTLEFQGGPMSEAEARAFESSPDFKYFLAIRSWDERAKDPDLQVPPLETYIPMLKKHIQHHTQNTGALPC